MKRQKLVGSVSPRVDRAPFIHQDSRVYIEEEAWKNPW